MTSKRTLLILGAVVIAVVGVVAAVRKDTTTRSVGDKAIAWDPGLEAPSDVTAEPPLEAAPQRSLKVSIVDAPRTVRSGDTVKFKIVLRNSTAEAILLDPCPRYRSAVGEDSSSSDYQGLLPCAAAPEVPAHGSVAFAMELEAFDVPSSGSGVLIWQLWFPTVLYSSGTAAVDFAA